MPTAQMFFEKVIATQVTSMSKLHMPKSSMQKLHSKHLHQLILRQFISSEAKKNWQQSFACPKETLQHHAT